MRRKIKRTRKPARPKQATAPSLPLASVIPQDRVTLTILEAAKVLGVGRNQAYEAAKAGEIPTMRVGKRIVVPRIPFERMLAGE